jgi:hypothetical protein
MKLFLDCGRFSGLKNLTDGTCICEYVPDDGGGKHL